MNIEYYYDALARCADRYSGMAASDDLINQRGPLINGEGTDSLTPFVEEFRHGCYGPERLPHTKLIRWCGYIQGVLIERKMTTVEAERNWTRPLFRPLDFGLDESDELN